jgi:hypothetical protein
MNDTDLLSTGEAAKLLSISRSTVSRKFDLGELQGTVNPLTGERLISRESIVALLKKHDLPVDLTLVPPKRVLVSDGDGVLLSVVRLAVGSDDRIKLAEATLGADALLSCATEPPDLLVIGDKLSDLGCAEVIHSLRRRPEQAKLKIICCLGDHVPAEPSQWSADRVLQASDWHESETLRLNMLESLNLPGAERKTEDQTAFEHRRRWPRCEVNLPARTGLYRLSAPRQHAWGQAVIQNISQGGAYLSPITFEGGGSIPSDPFRIMLEVDQPTLPQWRAYCQVVRLKSNGQLSAGVQFVRLSHEDRQKIVALTQASPR